MSLANTITGIQRNNNTDALFRAWGANLNSQMAAAGLVQTSDGTQINWGTVTTPLVGSVVQGYEIWRFNDAFQASAPVYLKFEYGSGVQNTVPGMMIAVGTGVTNIGGTIFLSGPNGSAGSNVASRISVIGAGSTTNASIQSFFSGSTNRWSSAMWVRDGSVSSNEPLIISIERTKDSNGNDTAEGLLCTLMGSTTWQQWVYDLKTGVKTPIATTPGILTPGSEVTSGVNGANTAIYPLFHDDGVGFLNPGMNLLAYYNGDITAGTPTTLSIYGSTHTYMPLGNTAVSLSGLVRAGVLCTLMMRYE
jgi:hypothetical protein